MEMSVGDVIEGRRKDRPRKIERFGDKTTEGQDISPDDAVIFVVDTVPWRRLKAEDGRMKEDPSIA